MDIKMKWFYRLGFLLLLFVVVFIFIKLNSVWLPLIRVFATVLFPFIAAAFVSYLLFPFVEKLHKNGLQRWLSVLIIYILFFGGGGYAIYKCIPIFINQLRDLSDNIPGFIEQYEALAENIEKQTKSLPPGLHQKIDDGFQAINDGLIIFFDRVLSFFLWLVDSFFLLLLIPFIAFYMMKDFRYLNKVFWSFIPKKWRKQTAMFLKNADESLGSYLRGQFIVCAIVGIGSAIAFRLIKLEYPLLLGTVLGITNVIPYFGPIIGAIPAS